MTYAELQQLFDHLDDRVDRVVAMGRKGSTGALRDALMIKTAYAYGLRRNELARLYIADLRPNPHEPAWAATGRSMSGSARASRAASRDGARC